jgi:hypothetical protein
MQRLEFLVRHWYRAPTVILEPPAPDVLNLIENLFQWIIVVLIVISLRSLEFNHRDTANGGAFFKALSKSQFTIPAYPVNADTR